MASMRPCLHLSDGARQHVARLGSYYRHPVSRCAHGHGRPARSSPTQAIPPRTAAPSLHGRMARRPLPLQATSPGRRARDEETAPGFTANYEAAMTMSALYSLERPAAIPLEEHERRRRRKDTAEIVEVGTWGLGGSGGSTSGGGGRTQRRLSRWGEGKTSCSALPSEPQVTHFVTPQVVIK